MTLEELNEKYGAFKGMSEDEILEFVKTNQDTHPAYTKYRDAVELIREVWILYYNEEISMMKALELTAGIIEEHTKQK